MFIVTLPQIARALWRHRLAVAATGLIGGLSGVLLSITMLSDYRASATVAPNATDASLGGLASLAVRFGLPVGDLAGSGMTIDFLARILESRELVSTLALAEYQFHDEEREYRGTYLDLLSITGDDERERLEAGVEHLRRRLVPGVDVTARMLTVEVRAPHRALAELVVRNGLAELDRIAVAAQQEQASAERAFLEERELAARAGLLSAEAEAQEFLEQNRSYEASPQLQFEFARLQRVIDLRQAVYTGISQALEQARIAEVRATPVLTVIDGPEGSGKQSRPLVVMAVLMAMVGVGGAMLLVVIRAFGPSWWAAQGAMVPGDESH